MIALVFLLLFSTSAWAAPDVAGVAFDPQPGSSLPATAAFTDEAGRSIRLKDGGLLQPYVRVAAAQEFSRRNDVKVNDSRFDNSLFGSRAEIGAGVSVSLSERLQLHADFDYMKGKRVEQPWGANVGLRFAF